MAGALPALQRCILRRWVWSTLCLKPFPYMGCWWSLTVKAGGEQDGCCDLRLEAGGGRSLHAFPPWLSSVEALSNLGNRWVAGSWGGQGPGLAWGAGSPPLALGHRPECPGGFVSSPGVQRQRGVGPGPGVHPETPLGKEPPEGFSLQAFLVERPPCHSHCGILRGEKKNLGSVCSPHRPQDEEDPPWESSAGRGRKPWETTKLCF